MKLLHSFEELWELNIGTVCALGTFDGVHRGHAMVISRAVCEAKEKKLASVVITFDAHPFTILKPSEVPPALSSKEERLRFIEELEVDYCLLLPMTAELMQMSAEEFAKLLFEKGRVKAISVGHNFTFGHKGIGTPGLLKSLGEPEGIEIMDCQLESVYSKAQIISSSAIRKAIAEGRLEEATDMLGRPFTLEAVVIEGDRRGRLLGFPTANFKIPPTIVTPPDGVYVTRVWIGNTCYNGIGNVGDNPTFENQYHRLEVHLLDFSGDLYGKILRVEFLSFIRGEEKFNSLEALVEQMNEDKAKALAYFQNPMYL